MRPSLLFLLPLIGSALASHDVCFKFNTGGFVGSSASVIVRDPYTTLMSETKYFAPFVSTMTFKNSIGRVDVGMDGTYSCLFNGVDNGHFTFQSVQNVGDTGFIRYGCYDISNDGYCNDRDSKYLRCLSSFQNWKVFYFFFSHYVSIFPMEVDK